MRTHKEESNEPRQGKTPENAPPSPPIEESLRQSVRHMAELPNLLFAGTNDTHRRLQQALAKVGVILGASRAYVMCDEDSGRFLRVSYEWINGEVKEALPSWPLHDYQKDIPSLKPLLQDKPYFTAHTHQLAPDLHKVLTKQSVASVLLVPLIRDGLWSGMVGVDSCGTEREWSPVEVDMLRHFSGLVVQALDRVDYQAVRRRLNNVRFALNDDCPDLTAGAFAPGGAAAVEDKGPVTLLEAERRLIVETLARNHGNRGAAARELGIAWAALDRRCKKLRINLGRGG